jgi:3-hydroxyisobutyrate dehydrogenase-like beta-hydroxyacid dehydrogenase
MKLLSIIGFGEAGQTFAQAAGWLGDAHVYDVKTEHFKAYAAVGVTGYDNVADALSGASLVLSLVTADQAYIAAQNAAQYIVPEALYFDMNSVAPDTKRRSAKLIEAAGGRYVDVAIMAPVDPARLDVPLLVAGPHAQHGEAALAALGFNNVRIVGSDVGRASTIKMLRSVMYKGMEALTAECLIACEKAGVTEEVLGSFGNDWATGADYRLDRMIVHGLRRAAEMDEVVKTLEGLGVDPLLTRGTAARQRAIGGLCITQAPKTLAMKLEVLK